MSNLFYVSPYLGNPFSMNHFLDTSLSSKHIVSSFAVPGGLFGSLQAAASGSMSNGLAAMTGQQSGLQKRNALQHVPGAAKPLKINDQQLDLSDPQTTANTQLFAGMGIAIVIGVLVGCLLFRRGGSQEDDDDEDEDSEDKSSSN